jgi:hypothetical protein
LIKLASRRRRRKSIGKVVTDVERRVRRVETRPGATRLKRNVVTGEKIQYRAIPTKAIQADAITANEAEFGVPIVSDTEPTDYLKAGTLWINPDDGSAAAYDLQNNNFVSISDVNAQASADGKNNIYYSTTAPAGTSYITGDTWFDTDDGYKIYTWTGSAWSGFELGSNAISSISATKILAGSLAANVIVTSNLDAGQITAGTLTGRTIRTAASGRRVEVDATNNALSFYNAAGTALGHIRPATDQAGVIISSGGSATTDFASSVHPKMIMYASGNDGQFTLILDNLNGGLSLSSSGGTYNATIGATNASVAVNPYGNRSLREIGIANAAVYTNLTDIQTVTGVEGFIVLTYT